MSRNRRIAGLAAVLILTLIPSAAFAAAPSNDTRSGATEIDALPYSVTQDVADATAEASDPRGCYGQPHNTVWFTHTAAVDGRLVASTAGSSYPTQIEVLEQSRSSLTSVACEHDDRPDRGVSLAFPVTAGRTYVVIVGRPEYTSPSGTWDLQFSLRAQPVIEVTLDRGVFSNRGDRTVTLTGTAKCSENVSVRFDPTLRQQGAKHYTFAHGQSYVACTPDPQPFDIRVRMTTEADFRAGRAQLIGTISAPGEAYSKQVHQEASVTICTIVGTVGDDELTGTSGADRICGLHGHDVIAARGGNDVVFGGPGRDEIRLGGGNDWAAGGEGADLIGGQRGSDTLLGGAHRDKLVGGKGYDRCTGGKGRDAFRSCEARRR